jgi:formate-dependent nitrite reductase membrane component NrfD
MDPKVNGQLQKEWGFLLAVYLFLGGLGGGAYTIAAINSFMGKSMELSTTVGLWIGFPALMIGSIVLIFDLGNPSKFILAGLKPGTSWIARGVWIISTFLVFSFLTLVLHQFTGIDKSGALMKLIEVWGIAFAIGTMAYTGILLGASKGIPFWRSGIVPVVFVISGLVTGHFLIMIGMVVFSEGASTITQLVLMAKEATVIVIVEILAIVFFLQAAFRHPDSRESAERILRKPIFVSGYIVFGLFLPFTLSLVIFLMNPSGIVTMAISLLAGLLGLMGGLLLRQSVLVCGALPTLNMGGFQFRRIARPKDIKPEIGLMPPQ